jgi:hypothetical protein
MSKQKLTSMQHKLTRLFDVFCMLIGWTLIIVVAFAALSVEAAEWFHFEIPYKATPPAASACGAQISVCQNNATSTTWQCYCVQ